jgi:hypothetical protein
METDDAVFLRCGSPPMTRKEFAAGFRDWSGRARIESKYEIKDIRASGFRKSPSGKWQLARGANLMPAGSSD